MGGMSSWMRPWRNFRANPSSIRSATFVIVSLSVLLVFVGAVTVWLLARREYPTFGSAVWLVLQTVTTVGYGDDPPTSTIGRVVTSFVMLSAIGLTTVITAIVTSIFVDSARAERVGSRDDDNAASLARIEASLQATERRLEDIEERIAAAGTAADEHR